MKQSNHQIQVASNGVIAMIFVLAAETMFFAGLISAYIINRAAAMAWPPANQPRLPVEVTAVNTVVLLASAVTLFIFSRKAKQNNSRGLLVITIILGLTFLTVQGTEWVKLIGFGLTTHSSIYGAFFYTLIGMHAAHVVAGLIILLYLFFKSGKPDPYPVLKNRITVCSMFWYFVVAVWPILYQLVYLS